MKIKFLPKTITFIISLLLCTILPLCLSEIDKVCNVAEASCVENETCDQVTSTCQCSECHGQNSNGTCSPLLFRRPCGQQVTLAECDDSCNGAKDEIYPEHGFCSHRNKRVQCEACYSVQNRSCILAKPQKGFSLACSSDCDCAYGLKCSSHCRCPAGFKWNPDLMKCEKPEFGEPCTSDADCNSYGRNGYTYRGGQCSPTTKLCQCSPGYFATLAAFVESSNGGFSYVKRICVTAGTTTGVSKGQKCDTDLVFVSDTPDTAICSEDTVCYSCPEDKQPGKGKCRSYNSTVVPLAKCVASSVTENTNNTSHSTAKSISRLHQACSNDSDCGTNEQCYQPPVEPACETGRCVCRGCFSPDENGLCSANKFLRFGEKCRGTEDEIYPTNSECYHGSVRCSRGYRLNQKNLECLLDSYNYVSHGAPCMSPYLSCIGDLECAAMTCACPLTNQRFDPVEGKCVTRVQGDNCTYDLECDEHSNRQYLPSGRFCSPENGTCFCDEAFIPIQTLTNSAYAPTMCGNSSFTNPEVKGENSVDTAGAYFTVEYLRGLLNCSIFDELVSTIVTETIVTEDLLSANSGGEVVSATSLSAGRVGKICFVNEDCGPNEECYSEFEPPCGNRTCACRPCYGLAEDGTCQFIVQKNLGDQCTGAGNEVLVARNSTCTNGTVMCDDCFTKSESDHICLLIPGSLFGSRCSKDCDCLQEAGLRCNTYIGFCDCGDQAFRWVSSAKRCELRDPTRRHSSTRCSRDDDCSLLGDRAERCDLSLRRCMCSQDSDLFDEVESQCVPRKYGEWCSNDTNCFGSYLEHGLTKSSVGGVCSENNTCTCGANYTLTEVRFQRQVPNQAAVLFVGQICVSDKTRERLTDVAPGGRCSTHPFDDLERVGTDQQGVTCGKTSICMGCPEDASYAKCRTPRQRQTLTVDQCERIARSKVSTTRAPVTSSMLGQFCSDNEDCGPLEECTWTNVTKGMRPRCGSVGICVCKIGYQPAEVANQVPKTKVCSQIQPVSTTPKVTHLEFGDNCTTDTECTTFPDSNNAGYSYGGGKCVDGSCGCAEGYKATMLGFVVDNSASVRVKTICVHRLANVTVATADRCTTMAVLFSDSPRLRICLQPRGSTTTDFASVCYRCPFEVAGDFGGASPIQFDGYTPFDGVCRLVAL